MPTILNSKAMETLVTLVEEAARSTEEGVKHFVEPAPGTLLRATSKRHHIVFGRRGSGKSSLLRKAGVDSLAIKDLGRWESLEMVQRYTRSVTFQDSLKFYKPLLR